MAQNEWQRRTARAEELGAQYTFATEILRFYVAIAGFQEKFYEQLGRLNGHGVASDSEPFERPLPPELTGHFGTFLPVIEEDGPGPLREAAGELRDDGADSQFRLLTIFWNATEKWGAAAGS